MTRKSWYVSSACLAFHACIGDAGHGEDGEASCDLMDWILFEFFVAARVELAPRRVFWFRGVSTHADFDTELNAAGALTLLVCGCFTA